MRPYRDSWPERLDLGVAIALVVIGSWAVVSVGALNAPLAGAGDLLWALPVAAILTHLYTGLFITAHDGMHGSISVRRPGLNRGIGAFCTYAHAMFPFDFLRGPHLDHHRTPGRVGDPDYHDGTNSSLVRWFLTFVGRYLSLAQWLRLTVVFGVLVFAFPLENVLLFWALPSIASTLQLFWFGTYLPHREPPGGYTNRHHARSNDLGWVWSFLSCYHFGYHLEHHRFPSVPWWRLPTVRAISKLEEGSGSPAPIGSRGLTHR